MKQLGPAHYCLTSRSMCRPQYCGPSIHYSHNCQFAGKVPSGNVKLSKTSLDNQALYSCINALCFGEQRYNDWITDSRALTFDNPIIDFGKSKLWPACNPMKCKKLSNPNSTLMCLFLSNHVETAYGIEVAFRKKKIISQQNFLSLEV